MNIYGQYSMIDGYNFKNINQKGVYGYWDHMDYIIRTAAKKGPYIGMVCIWGSPVNRGEMTVEQAKAYGTFLAERYQDEPNIIWFIGGDIRGDVKTAEWEALATSIKACLLYTSFRSFFFWCLMYVLVASNQPVIINRIN